MRLAPLTAALALWVAPALGQEPVSDAPAPLDERLDEVLARAESETPEELGQAIAGLGAEVAPLLTTRLAIAPGDAALRAAVRALGRDAFLPLPESSKPEVSGLLAVVELIGDSRDLHLTLELEGCADARRELALAGVLARDERGWDALASAALQAGPAAACCAFRVVGRSGDERAAAWLGDMLGYDTGLDIVLLSQLQEAARLVPSDESTRSEVRRRLHVVDDEQVLRKAVELTVVLDDDEALGRLIELLDHENEHVVRAAHQALCSLAGSTLPAETEAWGPWLANEQSWFEERSEEAFLRLRGPDRKSVLEAIRELARHRYQRRILANELAPLVFHDDPAVRRLACEGLRQIGVRDVAPELREALADEDAEVVAAAHRALVALGLSEEPPEELVAGLDPAADDDAPVVPLR